MHTITKEAYYFSELNNRAKERARDWYRQGMDHLDYDCIYDDAAEIAKILGFDILQTKRYTLNNEVRYTPTIWWRGFWSQGDGACFEGTYCYKKGCVEAIKKYAPKDTELHNIAASLVQMQKPWFYKLSGNVKHRGHYHHEYSMECSLEHPSEGSTSLPEDEFKEICADFARWIYKQLETEYEYQNSDEMVDEAITINEYEFDEDGKVI